MRENRLQGREKAGSDKEVSLVLKPCPLPQDAGEEARIHELRVNRGRGAAHEGVNSPRSPGNPAEAGNQRSVTQPQQHRSREILMKELTPGSLQ